MTQFMKLDSGLNTGGAVRMYHIPGSTPEAHTVDMAFGGKRPKREILIGEDTLRKSYATLNTYTDDAVDLAFIGCPHYNIVDLMLLSRKLEGKTCKTPLWIMTAPAVSHRPGLGYVKVFEDAGAALMSGTCLAAMGGVPEGVKKRSPSTLPSSRIYIAGCYPDKPLGVCYGSQDDCINAALTGRWRGEWNKNCLKRIGDAINDMQSLKSKGLPDGSPFYFLSRNVFCPFL
jgi:predicted aconitase